MDPDPSGAGRSGDITNNTAIGAENVVQANTIGAVFLPSPAQIRRHQALTAALTDATVEVGAGLGVVVGPDLVLTLARFADRAKVVQVVDDELVLIEDHRRTTPACLSPGRNPSDATISALGDRPGSPVLNLRTGGVYAVMTETGPHPVPPIDDLRPDEDWLRLLTKEQLAAGGWRLLSPELRAYLKKVASAGDRHEYATILDGGPPLGEIYLERTAQRIDGEGPADPPSQAEKLLEHYRGFQVTGEPGVGKSSLLRRIAAVAAEAWLDGRGPDYVPVLIAANDLRPGRPLGQAMVDGTLAKTSQILDGGQLTDLFRQERPLPGVQWLVLVDGLDEVIGLHNQSRILEAVEDHRRDTTCRLVVASRPISSGGFGQVVTEEQHPTFKILPFTEAKWIEFATGWLARQQRLPAAEARAAATELLRRVDATKIGSLSRIPLIASMICLLHVNGRTLPDNQFELYDRFVDLMLSKFRETKVGKQLRHYDEDAGRALSDGIADVLEQLAHLHQTKGPASETDTVPDRAMATRPAARPRGVPTHDWRELLTKVIAASGLMPMRDKGLEFLHPTIAEYLAARHLFNRRGRFPALSDFRAFAPRSAWTPPDTNVHVFLAARLLNRGDELDRLLLVLLWPGFRRRNAGFVVELVKHGLKVSDRVRARTVAVLRSMVLKPRLASPQWWDAVGWLDCLDRVMLVELLTFLANMGKPNRQLRRYEAITALLPLAPGRGVELAERFLTNPNVEELALQMMARSVKEHVPAASFAMLARLREQSTVDSHQVRLTAMIVDLHPAEGMKYLVEEVSTGDPASDRWRRMLSLLDHHAPELAVDGWVTLLRTTQSSAQREKALERLHRTVPDRIALAVTDTDMGSAARVEAASYGVRHLGLDSGVLHDLAVELTDARWSARAYAAWGGRRQGDAKSVAAQAIRELHGKLPPTSLIRFDVLEALREVDSSGAKRLLTEEIVTGAFDFATRFKHLDTLMGWATREQFAGVCRDLATRAGTSPHDALQAAERALGADPIIGVDALSKVIHAWPTVVGFEATRIIRRRSKREAAEHFVWLSSHSALGDTQRFRAADEAYDLSTSLGRQALRQLGAAQLPNAAVQLKVARRMLGFDRPAAQRLLREIAGRSSAPRSVRREAESLLDR